MLSVAVTSRLIGSLADHALCSALSNPRWRPAAMAPAKTSTQILAAADHAGTRVPRDRSVAMEIA